MSSFKDFDQDLSKYDPYPILNPINSKKDLKIENNENIEPIILDVGSIDNFKI